MQKFKQIREAAKYNPYAIGMAAAKKKAGYGPGPAENLPKSVVTKGHEIAKKIKANESFENILAELEEDMDLNEAEMSHAQILKKIKDGTHEAMTDIKPGKHVELRHTGTGVKKMVFVKPASVKEEVETVSEVSKATLKSYLGKANSSVLDLEYDKEHYKGADRKAEANKTSKKIATRETNIERAKGKLGRKYDSDLHGASANIKAKG